jgi:fucose permease
VSYGSSNMIDLDGPLTKIFTGFLLAIIGCVVLISAPEFSQFSYLMFLVAGMLVAVSCIALAAD